jgi:hypothetical protein
MIEAYPLQWPVGYKRTAARTWSKFKQSPDKVQAMLNSQVRSLGGTGLVISSNVNIRKDGAMYSDMMSANLPDPGIAVYFKYKDKDIVMCCDTYLKPWENAYALAKAIEALRKMEQLWGVSEFLERSFTGFKALPDSRDISAWHDVLGIAPNANAAMIKEAYRKMAQVHHPDAGGSVEMFNRISRAYQQGLSSLNK